MRRKNPQSACREFEARLQESLDLRSSLPVVLHPSAERHRAECASCRDKYQQYLLLDRALRSRNEPARAFDSVDLTDRVLARAAADEVQSLNRRAIFRTAIGVSAAAAAALIAVVSTIQLQSRPHTLKNLQDGTAIVHNNTQKPESIALTPIPLAPIGDGSIAEATSATFDLARLASAPAARIGGELLRINSDDGNSRKGSFERVSFARSASKVWRKLGDGVQAGVEPLSNPARRAFGFLLDPNTSPNPPQDDERRSKDEGV
jgi:hypothetical protein